MKNLSSTQVVTMKHAVCGLAAASVLAVSLSLSSAASAAGGGATVEPQHWSFSGINGHYDKTQLQRGFQVYKEVCSACHGLKYLYYRNLGEDGGPGFSEAAVKALAAEAEVRDGPNDEGEMFDRPGLPSDSMGSPYANDQEARAANNGALPPDLSLIAKARSVKRPAAFAVLGWIRDIIKGDETAGVDYLYGLMIGYTEEPPAGVKVAEGMYYNTVFEGHQIAMPSPLSKDGVEYAQSDVPQTVDQYARDVSAFLMWAAEPKLEERKGLGIRVMIYLAILALLLYLTKRKLWSRLGDH